MTAANNFLSDFYHLAEDKGLDADAILASAEIDRDMIDSPGLRIDTNKLAVVVESIWDQLQDESLGLSDFPIPRGAFFMMGKVAINEPDLRRALLTGIRFYGMVTDAFEVTLQEEGDQATLVFHMNSPQRERHYLFAEINLMAWHRFASWLVAESLTLNEIYFDYPKPDHVNEYSYLFPGQHRFNADFQGFSFDRKFLDRDISRSTEALKAFVKSCPVEFFVQPKTDFSISYELGKLLKHDLLDGICFPLIEDAADTLHMTKRTLIRKLKEEGNSYQQIKDLVRRDRAIYLLTHRSIPLAQIAEKVGFSDSAVFARAFKTWTGESPREYRGRRQQP
jgi:AraC-like DNA-binding protein